MLANLVAAWREPGARRSWWLAAVAIVTAERLTTFFYFIPTMIGLQSSYVTGASKTAASTVVVAEPRSARADLSGLARGA
jgi:hypothetical protein